MAQRALFGPILLQRGTHATDCRAEESLESENTVRHEFPFQEEASPVAPQPPFSPATVKNEF